MPVFVSITDAGEDFRACRYMRDGKKIFKTHEAVILKSLCDWKEIEKFRMSPRVDLVLDGGRKQIGGHQ